jgi:hypothetical protein
VDPARRQQQLPPPCHRPRREDHDRERERKPREVRVGEDVDRGREIDLPDQVRKAEAGDEQRQRDAQVTTHG